MNPNYSKCTRCARCKNYVETFGIGGCFAGHYCKANGEYTRIPKDPANCVNFKPKQNK